MQETKNNYSYILEKKENNILSAIREYIKELESIEIEKEDIKRSVKKLVERGLNDEAL